MKISYYGYSIERHQDQRHYLMNLGPFLEQFCAFDNPKFKNGFTYGGERVYLFRQIGKLYLFLMTRSHEIIKKINAQDLSVTEIYSLLSQQESLGFASYVHFDDCFFGYASTIMAPRVRAFEDFMNSVFDALGINDYRFVIHPFLTESTRTEVLSMPFIGRSTIQVNRESTLYEQIREFFDGTAEEFANLDSFEIIFKPKRRQDIKPAMRKVLNQLPDDGIEKFLVRAREELHGQLIDHYLAGKGLVSDFINLNDESNLHSLFQARITANQTLQEKIAAHEADKRFEKEDVASIRAFFDADAWPAAVSDL